MSKTIALQIEKCLTLIEGLRRNLSEVSSKGINANCLDSLENSINALMEASKECDALRAELSEKVKRMNTILVDVKDAYSENKKKIKSNYPQYEWSKYGVLDKR